MKIGNILAFFIGPSVFGALSVGIITFTDNIALGIILNIIGYVVISIGALFMILSYASGDQVVFLLPQRVDTLLVISDIGLPFLKHNFRSNASESDVNLVSGP